MAQMSNVIGEDLDFLISKFDETFNKAEKLSKTKIYEDAVDTTGTKTKLPPTTRTTREDILSRIGETNINVQTGTLLGSEKDVENAVSKAIVEAQKRGITVF